MLTTRTSGPRRAFTLVEVIVTLVILGLVAVGITRVLVAQTRFFDSQTSIRAARSTARSSMNILLSDLRMVQDSGGIDSASSDGKTIRVKVPYWYGLLCGTNAGISTVSMLPVDSAALAMSTYAGYAWRDTASGRYVLDALGGQGPVSSANAAMCTGNAAGQAQIRTASLNGRTGAVMDVQPGALGTAAVGTTVFFWQQVTYSFASSSAFPGKVGLWRNVKGATNEEILAPFDTSARFKFYQAGEDTSRTATPTLDKIVGLDIVLTAISTRIASGRTVPSQSKTVTAVFFKNVRTF